MKIVVCYKIVRNSQQIEERSDGTLDFGGAEYEISQYDTNAIEAAVTLASENEGSSVIALTVADGAAGDIKMRKGVLSRGPQELMIVNGEGMDEANTYTVADSLKKAIEKLGDVDVVICGEGSGDNYAQQTGVMLGAMLGWANVNGVSELHANDGALCVTRELENCAEELEVKLPAVVSVTSSINIPRIPALKDILQAGKKPVSLATADELGVQKNDSVELVSLKAPDKVERRKEIYNELSAEAIDAVCKQLAAYGE